MIIKHFDKFPQPDSGDLSAAADRWLSFNPFWWGITQGVIDELANAALWEDYTEEIDAAIQAMMTPHDLPECPAMWAHTTNFLEVDGGWTAPVRGTWIAGTGWSNTTQSGRRGVEIKHVIAATKILGILMTYNTNSSTTNEVYIAISNPTAQDLYRNTNAPNATRTDCRVDGGWDNVVEVLLGALNPGVTGNYAISRFFAWGEGTDPF